MSTNNKPPVKIILDKDGYLIRAGLIEDIESQQEILQTIKNGGTVKSIPYSEYISTEWKWIWDKPKEEELYPEMPTFPTPNS